ncbi:MAG: PilZ domain-containing protein [Magnetococcales bacterium]|nr:PilZ domain-containing protein [Magnetococcales bacterium]
MENTPHPADKKIRTVSLWWRHLTPVQASILALSQRVGANLPTMHPGMQKELLDFLEKSSRSGKSGLAIDRLSKSRMDVLDSFNYKLGKMLVALVPSQVADIALRFNPDSDGITFWLEEHDLEVSDYLEVQFYPSTTAPWPVHCCVKVLAVNKDKVTGLTRITCQFVTVKGPITAPAKREKPRKVVKPSIAQSAEAVNIERHKATKVEKPEIEPAALKVEKAGSGQKVEQPTEEPVKSDDATYDEILKKAKDVLEQAKELDVHVPAEKKSDDNSKRKDFRINDRIPFVWSVVSEETFQKESMPHFNTHHEFGLRTRIKQQQILLKEFDFFLKKLRDQRSKSRKYVVWFHEHLSWLFLRAGSENEEEYYQGITALFLEITKTLVKPLGRSGKNVVQILSQFKAQLENQKIRDLADPIMDADKLAAANETLLTLHNANNKVIAEMENENPNLSAKFKLFKSLIDTINLTGLDIPVGVSKDGKDLFTVNLSHTGLAFRTRRKDIKKGDLLEMRIFLSTGGERFDPVNCFGKVVFVQGPKDDKFKIATHIEPMPSTFKEKINIHVARRQREMLSERSALKYDLNN